MKNKKWDFLYLSMIAIGVTAIAIVIATDIGDAEIFITITGICLSCCGVLSLLGETSKVIQATCLIAISIGTLCALLAASCYLPQPAIPEDDGYGALCIIVMWFPAIGLYAHYDDVNQKEKELRKKAQEDLFYIRINRQNDERWEKILENNKIDE